MTTYLNYLPYLTYSSMEMTVLQHFLWGDDFTSSLRTMETMGLVFLRTMETIEQYINQRVPDRARPIDS